MKIEDVKILLIQINSEQEVQRRCFVEQSGLRDNQIHGFNALENALTSEIVRGYNAVFFGGSGQYNVSRHEPMNIEELAEFVRYCVEQDIPTLGTCYGAHLMAYALGGKVEYKPNQKELGTHEIHVLQPGKEDVLFGAMPANFLANMGRTDDIIELPITAVPLANSDKIQYHAFKIAGKRAYGIQFHPELDAAATLSRMEHAYQLGTYFSSEEEYEESRKNVQDTPEAANMLQKFIEQMVIKAK